MSPAPAPLPLHLPRTFSVQQGLLAGVSTARLRRGDLEKPFHGVRMLRAAASPVHASTADVRGEPESAYVDDQHVRIRELARAYATVMSRDAFFVDETAAVLHGLPCPHGDALHVGVHDPHRPPRSQGVRGRRVAPHLARITTVDDLPLADAASTWAMLGRSLSTRMLVILGDAIVNVPRDATTQHLVEQQRASIDDLHEIVNSANRPGNRRLRAALHHIRVGSGSPLETDYRLIAATAGLPEPQLDVEIRGDNGRLLGIADIAYPEHRTLVEIEGDHHRVLRKQWQRDIEKHSSYTAAGWTLLRLGHLQIRHEPHRAIALVRQALRLRGWKQ
ncbi:hypothetical protein [Microbacterium sp. YY-01]|uniref:hypothetical protein n=1 Tax=Microbacterium sp. YY-01 TaxID=3421634 RepID=UPI003D168216